MTKHIAPQPQAEIRSAVERIGAFAAGARSEHLTTDLRQLFKRNILDSIGCAIAAVAGPSFRPLRDQCEEYRAPVLDLKRRNSLTADEIEYVRCNVFKPAFDFAGGGSFGPKDHPELKEQGDY